jgi:integrase
MRIRTQLGIRPMAAKTANRYRETLATLFNWATKEKNVRLPGGINPALSVQRYPEPHPRIQFLTFTQIDEQLKALEELPQLQAMVAVYIYAGLRREELLWLTHEDIDWNAEPFGLISIRAKSVAGESWQPKTFGSNRSVPISSVLRPYLDRQRLRSAQSIWLFPNSAGGRYDPDNFSSDLRRANLKAGLAWGCLIFRHTFGTRLAKKGESLFKISVLMGNSPEICRRHYAALSASELTETVEFKPVRDASNARSQSAFA